MGMAYFAHKKLGMLLEWTTPTAAQIWPPTTSMHARGDVFVMRVKVTGRAARGEFRFAKMQPCSQIEREIER